MLGTRLGQLAEQRAELRGLIDTTLAPGVQPLLVVGEDHRPALLATESAVVEQLIQPSTHPQSGWYRRWAQFHGEPATTSERQQP